MVARGEIYWAGLPEPAGRSPVCILTRDVVLAARPSVTVAEITRRVRRLRSEVALGREHGLRDESVINCDSLVTISQGRLDPAPVGRLDEAKRLELDRALRFALDIRY